ncbi:MAG TPA: cell division protein FtsK [Candidatus Scatocola faecigallinarum]|nr:cell division protein FtsK [Candidatus Scatocola faecigallinarum]
MNSANIFNFPYRREILLLVSFCLSLLSFNFAVGITYKTWYRGFRGFIVCVWKVLRLCGRIIALLFKRRHPKTEEEGLVVKTKKEKAPKERKEPKVKADKEAEPAMETRRAPTAAAPKKKEIDDGYLYPDVNLLSRPKDKGGNQISEKELESIARDLENVLQEFGVNGKIVKVRPGPVVTLYELEPAPGTKTARVIGLADDIARSMSAVSVRIAVVPGSNTIGIEMPNKNRETVWFKDLLEDPAFRETKNTLNVVLGKDIGGRNVYADLAKMPHLLVAGTTGSGKSVGVNTMILSLLYRMRPEECKLIMIDPKMLEFSMYNGIPHLLTPVITDPAKAVIGLKWAVKEMEDRYRAMAQLNVRNIAGYNQKLQELKASGEKIERTVQTGFDAETGKPIFEKQELDLTPLPYIVIVVDEMADLMLVAGKDVEAAIQRLAQMARAAGLHLIMSTQRPSVDVITGTIKANFPTRISFQVTSKIDSRTILGEQGAEQLLGMGDMLYMPAGQRPIRVHGSFVKDSEVEKVVEFLKAQREPEYVSGVTEGELSEKDGGSVFDKGDFAAGSDEDLYAQAVAIVQNDKKASTSYIQRKLRIGYNRAASLIDKMEEEGIISAADHVGRREVL